MDLDILIEKLNVMIVSAGLGFEKLNVRVLTAEEQALLKKYRPDKSLIIYGTLAPNRSNHSEVQHIKGKWQKGVVKGRLLTVGEGYLAFQHTAKDEEQIFGAFVLSSDEWMHHWPNLDAFEGEDYQRILAKFELHNGQVVIGNIYAVNPKRF